MAHKRLTCKIVDDERGGAYKVSMTKEKQFHWERYTVLVTLYWSVLPNWRKRKTLIGWVPEKEQPLFDAIGMVYNLPNFRAKIDSASCKNVADKAHFKRRVLHVLNLMQISENNRFFSFALDSTYVKWA